MSTILLTAALVGTALLQGAEPNADETKKEAAAAEAPMEQPKAAPEEAETTAAEEAGEKTEAEASEPEGVERPSESGVTETKRVGAFWFISIGK